jgi:creatinine amidohydrolase
MRVLWGEMTAEELRELAARDALVIVPVASMEQHGPHLPTATDTILAREVAARAAKLIAREQPVVVTECVWTGLSEHHVPFGGTISLDFGTFQALLRGIARSLSRAGFKRVFLLNSHGGNEVALKTVSDELAFEFGLKVACATYWLLGQSDLAPLLETQKGIRHACEAETSMIMAVEPDLVRHDRLAEADCPDPRDEGAGGDLAYRWRSFKDKTPTGALGTPSAASDEKGTKLLDTAARRVAEALLDERLWG